MVTVPVRGGATLEKKLQEKGKVKVRIRIGTQKVPVEEECL